MPARRRSTRCAALALLILGLLGLQRAQARPAARVPHGTAPSTVATAAGRAAEGMPSLSADEPPGLYEGSWECRYGDSPVTSSGERSWATAASDSEWHPCTPPGTPPGRGGNNFLWQRTRLTGKNFHDPALFLLSMDQIFEAYLDGKLIYRFGILDGPGSGRYAGHRPHYLPLGPGYQGKLLALRIYSAHINIGNVSSTRRET